ncbi:hypothetical protein G7068_02235 [Leucobacter viscericola]|uniref:Uncharacterized protein n=1 Tax=Leucobacter viscericola TaxID=2714935 RepID=A0A6G7XCH9_9MICO|nr:hypothetical protein [Leucobacter viscericola]QIK62149.1 hypothetical protein G7068_02235 [Leucobacter viscericola]
MRVHPKTSRAHAWIRWILAFELLLGLAGLGIAMVVATSGTPQPTAVWVRTAIGLFLTALTLYYAWKASQGSIWAYRRLRALTIGLPIITMLIAMIPGFYPTWMIIEQILFSIGMITAAAILLNTHMRETYRPTQ